MRKFLPLIYLLAGGLAVYHADVIWERLRFEHLCKSEGGPRFYEAVEKDVGWQVEGHDTYDYQAPFRFEHVAFVRFEDKKGKRSDVRTTGFIGAAERGYTFSEVDETQQVRYSYRKGTETFGDGKFSKAQRLVIDLKTGKVVASFTQFGYSWTKPERTLLSMPTGIGCWKSKTDIEKFDQGIYSKGSNQ